MYRYTSPMDLSWEKFVPAETPKDLNSVKKSGILFHTKNVKNSCFFAVSSRKI